MSLINSVIAHTLPWMPRRLVWQVSKRYIAGRSLEDALDTVSGLNGEGLSATVDLLGEDVTDPEQVEASRLACLQALEEIGRRDLDSGLSVKLSELGLRFDEALCRRVVEELVEAAAAQKRFLRIDMEDSSVTDITLDIYRDLRRRHANVGCVIQACLRRSRDDVRALLEEGIAHVRLCKGIYIEPESVAYQDFDEIEQAFQQLLEDLVDGGAENVGIATHSPTLLDHARELILERELSSRRYEFQMLLGVAENLRSQLLSEGHRLRVYVPYGEHWFAYSSRRLRENPQIAGHVLKNLLRHD